MINSKVQNNAINKPIEEDIKLSERLRRDRIGRLCDLAVQERALTEAVFWYSTRLLLLLVVLGFTIAGARFAIGQSRLLIQEVTGEVRADG